MTTISTAGNPTLLSSADFYPLLSPGLAGRVLDEYYDVLLNPIFQTNINPFLATDTKTINGGDWTYVATGTNLGTPNYNITQLNYTTTLDPNIFIRYTGDIYNGATDFGNYSLVEYAIPVSDSSGAYISNVRYEGNILRGNNGIIVGGTYSYIRVEVKGDLFEIFGTLNINQDGEISGGTVNAYNFTDGDGNSIVATNANIDYLTFDANSFEQFNNSSFGVADLYASLTSGNETYGATGSNTMIGNKGDDTYIVDNVGDVITETYSLAEGGGTDTVQSSVSYTLSTNVDNLTLTGATNINATGNNLANSLTGNAGNNELNGGAGNDILNGGAGTDTAVFNSNLADVIGISSSRTGEITITTSEGTDTLISIESLRFLDGSTTVASLLANKPIPDFIVNGTPTTPTVYSGPVSYLEFEFIGSNGNDIVVGSANNDFMNLLDGVDAADGGLGDDVLDGGLGSNFLTGGAGNDTFFSDGRSGGITWSTITDFVSAPNFSGDTVNIWGWNAGTSQLLLQQENAGADGFTGATFHYDLNGDNTIDTSITFSGLTLAQVPDVIVFSDSNLLFFG
jgi:Ca2+-binding RTX toxin-like protein